MGEAVGETFFYTTNGFPKIYNIENKPDSWCEETLDDNLKWSFSLNSVLHKGTSEEFWQGFTQLFGDDNLLLHKDGKLVHLTLNERTCSGFVSQDLYFHGFFSASIKLPADYTAGVGVAFYMSNGDMFEKNHDEIDFQFLVNIRGKDWRIQTNIYGNGRTVGV
ncbi:hypothetical protein ACFE04_018529 [Oxalis oulophora]